MKGIFRYMSLSLSLLGFLLIQILKELGGESVAAISYLVIVLYQ